jgi:hypothetical protein
MLPYPGPHLIWAVFGVPNGCLSLPSAVVDIRGGISVAGMGVVVPPALRCQRRFGDGDKEV